MLRSGKEAEGNALRLGILGMYIFASIVNSTIAWGAADLSVGLMVYMNTTMIVLMAPKAVALLKDYEAQLKAGKIPFFDPDKAGIKNVDLWREINKEKIDAEKAEIAG